MSLWKRCPPHDWFPRIGRREFIVTHDICLRCSEERMIKPWGDCLGGHPIAEHYDEEGLPHPVGECWGPY